MRLCREHVSLLFMMENSSNVRGTSDITACWEGKQEDTPATHRRSGLRIRYQRGDCGVRRVRGSPSFLFVVGSDGLVPVLGKLSVLECGAQAEASDD